MKKFLSRIRKGCGDLPRCGPHPGTEIVIVLILIGGVTAGWMGLLISTVIYGSMYLWGAYERAKDEEFFERTENGNN